MSKYICVYCSSSADVSRPYFTAARELGKLLSRKGYGLVYGGGAVGLMGACALKASEEGAPVTGVIPEALNQPGVVNEHCDELLVTEDMGQRKRVMEKKALGFIALPGGFGTLEELLEIITLKQLGYHHKPVVILNTNGFYDELLAVFDKIVSEQFAPAESRHLYLVTDDPEIALEYIEHHVRK